MKKGTYFRMEEQPYLQNSPGHWPCHQLIPSTAKAFIVRNALGMQRNCEIQQYPTPCSACEGDVVVPVCCGEVATHMLLILGRYLMYALGK